MPAAADHPSAKKDTNGTHEPFAGYFASVAFALIISGWLAGAIFQFLTGFLALPLSAEWRVNLGAAIFLGLSFANPVGVATVKSSLRRAVLRFSAGCVAGLLTQVSLFTPLAGERLSTYLFLVLSALMVPLVVTTGWVREQLAARGIRPGEALIGVALRLVQLDNRLLYILFMAASFGLFLLLADGMVQSALGVGAVLAIITLLVALTDAANDFDDDPDDAELRAWLELVPEDEPELAPSARLSKRLVDLAWTMLPGAVLFGAMTRLAVDFIHLVYPSLQTGLAGQTSSVATVAIVGVSGLAFVFFGMMAAFGFSLVILRAIARARHWAPAHLQVLSVRLARLMYFHPMKRN